MGWTVVLTLLCSSTTWSQSHHPFFTANCTGKVQFQFHTSDERAEKGHKEMFPNRTHFRL